MQKSCSPSSTPRASSGFAARRSAFMKKVGYALMCLALTAFGGALIIHPERYVTACFEGFSLWAKCVLPSLFPFIILSLTLVKTGIAERVSLPLKRVTGFFNLPANAPACFLMSICSGYPAGSRILAEFYEGGALTKEDVDKLAPLCSTSGPLFIIGSVGFSMFGNKETGLWIFAAHALSALLFTLVYCRFRPKSRALPRKMPKPEQNLLYSVFYGGVVSVAVAGGFIAFFYVAAKILSDFGAFEPLAAILSPLMGKDVADAFILGLAEITSGCKALSNCSTPLAAPLAGFIITFGGISIIMQQLGYLTKIGVSPLKFTLIKAIEAGACFLLLLPCAF